MKTDSEHPTLRRGFLKLLAGIPFIGSAFAVVDEPVAKVSHGTEQLQHLALESPLFPVSDFAAQCVALRELNRSLDDLLEGGEHLVSVNTHLIAKYSFSDPDTGEWVDIPNGTCAYHVVLTRNGDKS